MSFKHNFLVLFNALVSKFTSPKVSAKLDFDEKLIITTLEPVEAAMCSSLRDTISDVWVWLLLRDKKVLRIRFGIEMNTDHTLEEVDKQFEINRERIRQIQAKIFLKLPQPTHS